MSLNAKKIKGKTKFERPPALEAGTYPARLVQIIGMGLQKQRAFKGEEKDPKIDLHLTYELVDEFLLDEDGNDIPDKPRWISETIPLNSLDSDLAKSTKRYYALDPSCEYDGEWPELVGFPCMLTLSADQSKKDKDVIYNNVASVQTMREKDAKKMPDLINPSKVFDFYEPDLDVFLSLPTWMQDQIKENLDYEGSELEAMLGSSDRKEQPKKETKEEDNSDEDW